MQEIFSYLPIGIFIILSILSIYRSIEYGRFLKSFWKWILMFILFGIIAFWIFFSLCGGSIAVYWIFWWGTISLLPYLNLLIISSFIYWYGILWFHQKLINRTLSLGGFIFFNIAFFIFIFKNVSEFWSIQNIFISFISLSGLIGIFIWGLMIYAIIRIWNFDPVKNNLKRI